MHQAKEMINITLPDGKVKNFPSPVTGFEFAASISKSLEKAALAVKINGELKDLSTTISSDCTVSVITADSQDGLEIIRHDAAHILAEAVKNLFPETQVTIGPVIENGFFYDFARAEPFSTDDLAKIESEMKKIVARNSKIERKVMSRDEAIEHFKKLGENYKVEIIQDLPASEDISLYFQGDFADLCRGPHSPSTGRVKAFKLMKVAGAYWRGDSSNPMLQRIYGTAWASEEQLKDHLHQIEEAEKRDHRKLGKQLELFHLQDEAPGMVFWHPKGYTIYRNLENYIRAKITKADYVEVKTPQVFEKIYWEQSGHWENYRDKMFVIKDDAPDSDKTFALKPMNCPGHVQIFKQTIKSYRDLPIRMSEFGCCHRNETSGSMHGLMRVRQLTIDDAHIFCTEDQIVSETALFCNLVIQVYKDLGFENVRVVIATRPDKRAGSDEIWDKAEQGLQDAAAKAGLQYTIEVGEGAFYGPKLEFHLTDAIGRSWQCGTLQLDFVLPERLDANYIAEDGSRQRPVMLHRAILGSMERFIGIMLEHYSGVMPIWLSPMPVVIASITNDIDDYAIEVRELLKANGINSELDLDSEKISYKVRKHSLRKVPIFIVVGKNERAERKVSIRRLGSEAQEILDLNEFVNKVKTEATPRI
jgi:threonyl-tRNA synthetase